MANIKNRFRLTFPENLKKNSNEISTNTFSFDDLADFSHEKDKLQRVLEKRLNTDLKVDYSNYKNHVCFNSAFYKFDNIKNKVLNEYPYNGTSIDKENFELSGTGYQKYILEQWPRAVCYTNFDGVNHYITSSDYQGKLLLGSSSLYLSAWLKPGVAASAADTTELYILELFSSSISPTRQHGYRLWLSGTSANPWLKFSLYSGSVSSSVSASYGPYISNWTNFGIIYDNPGNLLSMYISTSLIDSCSVDYKPIEYSPRTLYVGSGSFAAADRSISLYSGSFDELRICHTASELYHYRTYCQGIDSEDFVQLYYPFKEGIVGTSSIDKAVVDYSKNAIHGIISNYDSTFRVSGSSMPYNYGNIILYSFHSGVIAFTSSYHSSASLFDNSNKSYIYRLVANDVLETDESEEDLLRLFLLAMAAYFDEIKLYIDQLDNLRITNYNDCDETPDQFLSFLKRYLGFKATDQFADADPLEFLMGDNVVSSGSLLTKMYEVRDQLWRRILNNAPYLFKSRGKRAGIDAFMNTLGINPQLYKIKEYGQNESAATIQDQRVYREKAISFLGFGTGSLSSSYVRVPGVFTSSKAQYTVETFAQLPYASASYSGSVKIETGSIWQFVDYEQITGSFGLLWTTVATGSVSGTLVLTGSNGAKLTTEVMSIFDGDIVHIAAGLKSDRKPFIEVRKVDYDNIEFSSSIVGSTAFSGVFTGSKYDFIIGANSGSKTTDYYKHNTHGYYGQVKIWDEALSSSELNDHALSLESVGRIDPLSIDHLVGYWPLSEFTSSNAIGNLYKCDDLSRNQLWGTGSNFVVSKNPYQKFWIGYNMLTPSFDYGWSENKIRVRNLDELKEEHVAHDSDDVSLEFNLVDALNEDIGKIFSTFDVLNSAIGAPINKYRDEYSDLEAYRRQYFKRLGDSINFMSFFKAFQWFDRKLSDAIKQFLPAKSVFVGGEQVIESHMLERPKYKYVYNIFKTPKDINVGEISGTLAITSGSYQKIINDSKCIKTAYVNTQIENNDSSLKPAVIPKSGAMPVHPKDVSGWLESDLRKSNYKMVSTFGDGDEIADRITNSNIAITSSIVLVTASSINRITADSSGALYAVGSYYLSSGLWVSCWQTLKSHITASSNWYCIDTYTSSNSSGLVSTTGKSIAIGKDDTIYAVGAGPSGSLGNYSMIIRSSSDHGTTWGACLYNNFTASNEFGFGVAVDSNNIVYTCGYGSGTNGGSKSRNFCVWQSTNSGSTWTEVSNFDDSWGYDTAYDLCIDSNNVIYAAGFCRISFPLFNSWIIRSSSNGTNWGTVDLFSSTNKPNSENYVYGIATNASNNIFAVGYYTGSNLTENFLVRKSSTGKSGSFSISDDFDYCGGREYGRAICCKGNDIYAAGYTSGSVKAQGLIRHSSDSGNTWDTFDIFGNGTSLAYIYGIYVDISGNVYVCGVSGSAEWSGLSGFIKKYSISYNPRFSRVYYNGDTKYDNYRPNTTLNFKNEWAKNRLKEWENKNYPNAHHSGVFISSKLGSLTKTESTNTSNDDISWQGGYARNIKLIIWGLTSSYDVNGIICTDKNINKASEIYLTGANGTELSQSLFDEVNSLVDTGSFIHKITGNTLSTAVDRYDPVITFKVSSSAQSFNSSQFTVEFKDDSSPAWTSYKNVVPFGTFFSQSDKYTKPTGWYEFEYNMISGSKVQLPRLSLQRTNVNWRLSASTGKTYVFKDVKLTFNQPLVEAGIEYYRNLDNQNIVESYIKRDVLKDIEK